MKPGSFLRAGVIGFVILLFGMISGCTFPPSDSTPIKVTSMTITLEWDPPAVSYPSGPLALSSYNVYFKIHGTEDWSMYKQIPAVENPSIPLPHADFGDGSFDFATSAVNVMGEESPLHSSMDASASPYGGWHLVWMLSN